MWNPSALLAAVFRLIGRALGRREPGEGAAQCVSLTTGCLSPPSPQSRARPPPTPACCPPALRWTGGVMIPTPPHICRHTWTASQWVPRAPLPQVSRCSPQAALRWPLQLLLPGHLPSFRVYLERICQPCVMVCFTLCCSLLWGKLVKKGNSDKLISNLMPYWQKMLFFLNLVADEGKTWKCNFQEEKLLF